MCVVRICQDPTARGISVDIDKKPVVGFVNIKNKLAVGSYDFLKLKCQQNVNIGNYTLIYMAPAVGIEPTTN